MENVLISNFSGNKGDLLKLSQMAEIFEPPSGCICVLRPRYIYDSLIPKKGPLHITPDLDFSQ